MMYINPRKTEFDVVSILITRKAAQIRLYFYTRHASKRFLLFVEHKILRLVQPPVSGVLHVRRDAWWLPGGDCW